MGRRLLVRLTALAVGLAGIFALLVALFQDRAEAQINIGQLICAILLSLINGLPAFFGGILNTFLVLFGCGISG